MVIVWTYAITNMVNSQDDQCYLQYSPRAVVSSNLTAMRRLCAVCLFLVLVTNAGSARDIAAVVSKASPVKAMTLADLIKMVKTTRKWPDGKPVTLVMKDPGSAGMKLVLQKVFGMSADEAKALVAANKQSFLLVDSDAAVVKTVASIPNSLGLLDIYSITGAVSVVKIDGKSPLEPGYVLHGQ